MTPCPCFGTFAVRVPIFETLEAGETFDLLIGLKQRPSDSVWLSGEGGDGGWGMGLRRKMLKKVKLDRLSTRKALQWRRLQGVGECADELEMSRQMKTSAFCWNVRAPDYETGRRNRR